MKLGLPGLFYSFGCNFCLLRVMCAYTKELEMTPESVTVEGRRGVACKSELIYINREERRIPNLFSFNEHRAIRTITLNEIKLIN